MALRSNRRKSNRSWKSWREHSQTSAVTKGSNPALQKGLRLCVCIQHFIRNSVTTASDRKTGLLNASEIDQQRDWWIKRAQEMCQTKDEFQEDKLQLNLQPNGQGILECRGRIQGKYPIQLPDSHLFTYKLVQ